MFDDSTPDSDISGAGEAGSPKEETNFCFFEQR